MTRYANVALKRTYVQAGFDYREADEDHTEAGPSNSTVESSDAPTIENGPSIEKSKRRRKKKEATDLSPNVELVSDKARETEPDTTVDELERGPATKRISSTKAEKAKKKMKEKRLKGMEARKAASEQRRLRRQEERDADTTCFACREKGHAARHCPKAIAPSALDDEGAQRHKTGRQAVGICYRCGSRKHNLSRCKAPVDSDNPLPFSSCFVCSKQGHLASSCPQNQSKGVYPNGGCCKLCGETTHLAKNCTLRRNESATKLTFLGTGEGAGADEDDFHTFRRKTAEVTKEEKADERWKKQRALKVGAHSGIVKAFGNAAPQSRKVVTF